MLPNLPTDAVDFSQFKGTPMITTRHRLLALESYMDPSNGTVPWHHAMITARLLNLSDAFSTEYGHMEGERLDCGEFNVWALNLL